MVSMQYRQNTVSYLRMKCTIELLLQQVAIFSGILKLFKTRLFYVFLDWSKQYWLKVYSSLSSPVSDLIYPHSVQQLASCRRFPSRKSSCTFLSKAAFQALFDESVCKNLQAVAFLRPRHYSKKKYKIIQLIFYGVVGIKGQLHKRKFFGGPWKGLISTCFFGAFLNKYTSSHRESYVLYHCYHITVSLFECQKQKPEISVKFIGW